MNRFKKYIAAIMFAVMLVTTVGVVVPLSALAEEASLSLYVSATGSDSNDGTTEETAVASLAKASTIANEANEKAVTINVLSDLTSTACARFYNKDITIVGGSHTITRGEKFDTISDNARSWYNPAMIEVQTTNDTASLNITNLTLDDAGRNANGTTSFKQAPDTKVASDKIVQSAVIESTPTKDVTITLGEGTKILNYGGMSAVRVTGPATLVMKSGSAIIGNGTAAANSKATYAVWCQGANVDVREGATIKDIVKGQALHMDGGDLKLAGTVSNVSGVVLFTRNGTSVVSGEISGCQTSTVNGHVLQTGGNTNITFTKSANIHDNTGYYGVLYLNSSNDVVDFYGKLNNNYSTRYGAVVVSNNGDQTKKFVMHEGAQINDNISAKDQGGAAAIFRGTFVMNGGEMTGNKSVAGGGAVFIRKGGMFEMNGGSISGNYAAGVGGGVDIDAYSYTSLAYAKINGGEIKDNYMNATVTVDATAFTATVEGGVVNNFGVDKTADNKENAKVGQNLFVSKDVTTDNEAIAFVVDGKSVTPSVDTYIGNAAAASVTALTDVAASYGWGAPIASFWKNTSESLDADITGITFDSSMPVYVIVADADETGKAIADTEKVFKAVVNGDVITASMPKSAENGSVVVLVQPTKDFGTLTHSQLESITKDSRVDSYTVNYSETFEISENLLSMMKTENGASNITFTVDLDSRLAANDDATITSDIFEKASASVDGSTVTVTATLKDGWQNATGTTTVSGTATLDKADFKVGDTLDGTATFTETVGNQKVLVPAAKASTLMKDEVLYKVTYDLQGGTSEEELEYVGHEFGSDIVKIADPTKDGSKFLGWYEDAEGTTAFDFDAPLTGDVTIYAVWEEITTVPEETTTETTTTIDDETPQAPTKPSSESTTKPSSTTTTTAPAKAETTTEPVIISAVTRPATTAQATTAPAKTETTTAPADQTAIIDDETPLVSAENVLETPGKLTIESSSSWALLNVILVVLSLVVAILETVKFASKKYRNNNGFGFIIAMVALVANAIVLFMTQDFTAPMAFVDNYTIINGAIALFGTISAILLSSKKTNNKTQKSSK